MQYKYTLPLFAAALLAMASCKKGDGPVTPDGKDLDLTTTELQKVSADNQFSIKLFQSIAGDNTTPDNVFISPLSASFAFGMVANGASNQTADAIRNTMLFNNFTEDQVNTYYGKLVTGLPLVDPNTTIKVANSIWYDQNFSVLPQFLQTNSSFYRAKVQKADFKAASTVTEINNWVSQQTNNKIPTIVTQIPDGTFMYLINAVYFKSAWQQKFDASKTAKMNFTTNLGANVQADFMTADKVNVNYFNDADAAVFEIPYINNKFSMVIIDPQNGRSVQQVLANLDGTKLGSWMASVHPSSFRVVMPKFKFSFNTGLKNVLSDMGMANAFSDQANFSRLSTSSVKITDAQQKAYVEVNEEGTEAAAVTSISVGVTAVLSNTLTLDRPFIFAIREVKTGLILFIGVMNNPLLTGNGH